MNALHVATLVLLSSVAAFAQPPAVKTAETLPPKLAALEPQGMKVVYQRVTAAPTLAAAEFSVEKALPEGHTLTYTFDLKAFDTNTPLWKMREPIYKQQVNQKIAQETSGAAPAYTEAEAPQVTQFGWGSGITRRLTHHPPQSKEYVDYQCVYFGMIGGVTFDLRVTGLQGSCDAANLWAANVASTAAKTSVSNIAD